MAHLLQGGYIDARATLAIKLIDMHHRTLLAKTKPGGAGQTYDEVQLSDALHCTSSPPVLCRTRS